MASFNAFGVEELIGSFEKLANIPNEVIDEMCSAAADIAVKAYKAAAPVNTGELRKSIQKKLKYNQSGEPFYVVYPMGLRKAVDRNKKKRTYTVVNRVSGKTKTHKIRNADVGFILEYGDPRHHIPATQWMSRATAQFWDSCVAKEFEIYSEYINRTTGGST